MGKLAMFGAALAFVALLFNTPGASAAASDQMETLNRAATTIEHMKSDPPFEKARSMMKNAKAVLVVPRLVKGGFIFGAEGGNGVLMKKNGDSWSSPAFYTLGSASFGLQAGLEQAEVVMLIMSDRALDAVTRSEFKIGAGLGLTLVNLSAGAEAATPPNLSGDIIIWTSAKGLYGGFTLNGSIVKQRDEWNTAFYGHPVPVSDILADRIRSPEANPIRQKLASL